MATIPGDHAPEGPAISGVVRGTTIELNSPTGLAEGQRVIVTIVPVDLPVVDGKVQCEGIWRSLGSWAAAGPEFDEWTAEREADRAAARRSTGGE
ncbi:MAG: hypothetical protein WD875_07860 [Pirellulales bacterium]